MSSFIQNIIPKNLDNLHFNRNLIKILKRIALDENMSHLMFYGPKTTGKKTIVNAFLREIFEIDNIKRVKELIKVSNSNTIEVLYHSSENHFIINPSIYNIYDKVIIQVLIKNIAKTKSVVNKKHKIIVILNSNNLSIEAQNSLRRTFEIYMDNCRFILITSSSTKIISPLGSRTLKIRCAKPKKEDLECLIKNVTKQNNFKINNSDIQKIILKSNFNIETILVSLEILIVFNKSLNEIKFPEDNTKKIINKILYSKNIQEFIEYKDLFYKMIVDNITPTQIIKKILKVLINLDIENNKKHKIITLCSKYEHSMCNGSKEFFYVETLFMELYSLLHSFPSNTS
jgi:DNA polymerase III delta prime subunit